MKPDETKVPVRLRQLAQRIESWGDEIDCRDTDCDDVRRAALVLEAIGDPEWLGWWTGSLADIPETLKIRLAKVADAAAAARGEG